MDIIHVRHTANEEKHPVAICASLPHANIRRARARMGECNIRRAGASRFLATWLKKMLRRYHALRKRLSRARGGVASFNADNTRMTLLGEVYCSAEARFVGRGRCCGSEDTWWVWLLDGVDVIGSDFLILKGLSIA